jgi:hypothetical protein
VTANAGDIRRVNSFERSWNLRELSMADTDRLARALPDLHRQEDQSDANHEHPEDLG